MLQTEVDSMPFLYFKSAWRSSAEWRRNVRVRSSNMQNPAKVPI